MAALECVYSQVHACDCLLDGQEWAMVKQGWKGQAVSTRLERVTRSRARLSKRCNANGIEAKRRGIKGGGGNGRDLNH